MKIKVLWQTFKHYSSFLLLHWSIPSTNRLLFEQELYLNYEQFKLAAKASEILYPHYKYFPKPQITFPKQQDQISPLMKNFGKLCTDRYGDLRIKPTILMIQFFRRKSIQKKVINEEIGLIEQKIRGEYFRERNRIRRRTLETLKTEREKTDKTEMQVIQLCEDLKVGKGKIEKPIRGFMDPSGTIQASFPVHQDNKQGLCSGIRLTSEIRSIKKTFSLNDEEMTRIRQLKTKYSKVTSVIEDPETKEKMILVGLRKKDLNTMDKRRELEKAIQRMESQNDQ